jgi:hypothetical protein
MAIDRLFGLKDAVERIGLKRLHIRIRSAGEAQSLTGEISVIVAGLQLAVAVEFAAFPLFPEHVSIRATR